MNLADDRRWKRFNDREFECPCCGQTFGGVFDIGCDHPDPWPHGSLRDTDHETLVVGQDKLSSDLCAFAGGYYIRCILPLPVLGSDQSFAYGVWASVKDENFNAYVNAWQNDDYSDFPGCFAWLMNDLPGWAIEDWLPCGLETGDGGDRPVLWVHEDRHPLATAQREGITFDRLLDLYAAAGTDIRPHLADA
ncbi:MAG: DUF2199 domain-containing protein [Pseudomonadota bacterium]